MKDGRGCRWLAGAAIACLLPAAAPAADEPAKKVSLGVGSIIVNYSPVGLAQQLGYFKSEGLDVTVENFQAGGSKSVQALIGGSVDLVAGFYDHTIQMQAKGKDIVAVFLLADLPGVALAIRPDLGSKVSSGKDLKGLKLGITSPGSSTDMIARYYLHQNGLTPSDVPIIAVGSGAPGLVALENKSIDALLIFDPIATKVITSNRAKILFDARTLEGSRAAFGGPYPSSCIYTTRAFAEKNPDTVQRMANALLRTLRWIQASAPEKIVEVLPASWKSTDNALYLSVWKSSKGLFSQTGKFDLQALQTPLAVLSLYDPAIASAKVDLTRTFTNRFAEEAGRRVR